jgi:hypothetical protein
MRHFFILLSVISTLVIGALSAQAQSYRYVDSSGNIHFVDSWKAVPRQYREQIVPATPTPVLDKKTLQKRQRERERLARDEKNRLEREKKRREKEVADAQKQRRIGASISEGDDTAKRRRRAEDDIEVIN